MKRGFLCLVLSGCSIIFANVATAQSISGLRLLSQYELPHNLPFKNTTVGGLSGIDYDSSRDVYYMICDDRSSIHPARFYTARIFFDGNKIDSVSMVDVTTLLRRDGSPYPSSKQDPVNTPDPEAMRYNPVLRQWVWSSEGERIVKKNDTVLCNPSINVMDSSGRMTDSFPITQNMIMHTIEKGPRQNGVLEGMSFADNFKTLYVNVEEPLYEDGPRADVAPNEAWIRIFRYDTDTKKNTAQYAYKLDPIAYPTLLPGTFKVNGVPDILWLQGNRMIVMERSFSTGRLACTIKLFLVHIDGAENIIHNPSLLKQPPARPLKKQLLLNMDSLHIYTDNVEGMTFGPRLANGHRTLVLVADNNFAALEKTQFFVFEVME